jgi:RNA polymerase subunit RPABC4/transcription elongation factor Spt4
MNQQTGRRRTSSRIPDHYPCPDCHRIVKVGEKFCGYCRKALQVQCSHCGSWTKEAHRSCPQCGTRLHQGGPTFAEKQQQARLQRELKAAMADYQETKQRLAELITERTLALLRLLVVVLVSVVAPDTSTHFQEEEKNGAR